MYVRKSDLHSGSSAFLIVPAIQAADRRILNSKPSFETRVTYSVGLSSAIMVCGICCKSDSFWYCDPEAGC